MWINLFRKVRVTNKIYNKFIDTGKVPNDIITLLALKVIEKKELNEKELAIFFSKTSEINEVIVDISKKDS